MPKQINLDTLTQEFGLQRSTDPQFFSEWKDNLPNLGEQGKQFLDRVRSNYTNLTNQDFLNRQIVKMTVLSPLLDLANFYQAPFQLKTDSRKEYVFTYPSSIVTGDIDVLIIENSLWILTLDSQGQIDIMAILPHALSYLLKESNRERPSYGLLVNDREFVFLKLSGQETPVYNRSHAFAFEREGDLEQVLSILKNLSQIITNPNPATDPGGD